MKRSRNLLSYAGSASGLNAGYGIMVSASVSAKQENGLTIRVLLADNEPGVHQGTLRMSFFELPPISTLHIQAHATKTELHLFIKHFKNPSVGVMFPVERFFLTSNT